MSNDKAAQSNDISDNGASRRRVLAVLLGACGWLPKAFADNSPGAPVRLAISETLVADVNITDARAAMLIWIKRMMADLKVSVILPPKVFETTEEILRRARTSNLDAVALNVAEYRQIADVLDASQIIAESGPSGEEKYILLVKKSSGFQRLGDLRKTRLTVLKGPKMCVANAWLSTLLNESHLGASEQFFSSVTVDSKVSRVVLPVFFGQADACITSKSGFETMCELNPQVGRELNALATSPGMVVSFYVFHRNYHGVSRERFAKVYADLPNNPAGKQLAILFQFQGLVVKDISCLASALTMLEAADRVHGERGRNG